MKPAMLVSPSPIATSLDSPPRVRGTGHAKACASFMFLTILTIPRTLVFCLLCAVNTAQAMTHVSVGESSAILYDAPALKAKKLFVVNRYMPFELIVTQDNWVKVRDRSGGLYWLEKRVLSNKNYVFSLNPIVDVHTLPDLASPRLFQIRGQIALELLETLGNGWVKVRHKDGESGYVPSSEVWGE